ncbi:MAG: histidine phosphatase family protein [Verrucomicrobia bacterium]|nr:histidine phosphatase family protein [Verrucomicrobiota bacterium]
MGKLILLRHGQSAWNKENVFTGWIDIPLSKEGIVESIKAGEKIKDVSIDEIYTSTLVRAQVTVFLAMTENSFGRVPCVQHDEKQPFAEWYQRGSKEKNLIPVYLTLELNERMYGDLQGKNKQLMQKEYGEEQVQLWRRSFHTSPPGGESLAKTAERSIPFFIKVIIPKLASGKTVLICAHGNSLRSIVMYIEKLSEEEVLNLEIATGEVKTYDYKEGVLLPV